ncbi:MAG: lysostaphin resistance A-like protein [Bacteroidota bacterium]
MHESVAGGILVAVTPTSLAGPDLRLRDLAYAGLLSAIFMAPLTIVAAPLLLASKWNQVTIGVTLEAASVLPAVFLIARWRGARHLDQFGLGRCSWRKILFLGLLGGLLLFLMVQGCGSLMERCGARFAPQKILAETLLLDRRPDRLLLFLLIAAVIAPLWEEIFFRGLAYPAIRRRLGVTAGVLLSGVLFAMLHAEPLFMRVPIFLLGACLAIFYERAGSLYVPILAHGVANTLSTLLTYYGLVRS